MDKKWLKSSKKLEFFEKDTISWDDTSLYDFYKQLFHFKKENGFVEWELWWGHRNSF